MAAVSETIVREFFELHGFLIRQQRKYVAPNRRPQEDDDIDFFALNPHPEKAEHNLPFLLGPEDLRAVTRAIVVVKGWHSETFSTARLTSTPELFRFVQPKVFEQAARAFGADGAPLKLLVLPSLPHEAKARDESVALLKAKGVDGVIPFRTILVSLIAETKPNRNYQKSDLLQIIRILKTYDLMRDSQLELFKSSGRRKKR
jgi:hypothetical protein